MALIITTGKAVLMIGTCAVVGGAMTVIMIMFLKKLHKIEVEFWGDSAMKVGGVIKEDKSSKKKKEKKEKK